MNSIFDKTELSGIMLKNRIIRSATHEGLADANGCPTEALKKYYRRLASGDVGAIITGYAGVRQNGKSAHYNMLMIDKDEHINKYKEITDAVHEYGTPIILQIAHCGKSTRSKVTGEKTVAPSAFPDKMFDEEIPIELTEQAINGIINSFVLAIVRGKKAGFDGVQLHLAHGYLLAQFLSSYTNRRTDRWGGCLENKYRIIDEIFRRAREAVGDYPILVKLNGYDGSPDGMRIKEAVQIAMKLEKSGCSGIEVSCGAGDDGLYSARSERLPVKAIIKAHFKFKKIHPVIGKIISPFLPLILPPIPKPIRSYNVQAAEAIKKSVSIPVIAVGGIKSMDEIEGILENEKADFVSMCRPFILEPDIVNKFKQGISREAKCIYCNYCTVAQFSRAIRCYYGKI